MPLWWKSRGAPAHLPQSLYPLTLGREVQKKALPTARPRVSTLMMLQRSFLTKGRYLLQIPLKERFVTFGLVKSCKRLFFLKTTKKNCPPATYHYECFSVKSTSQISKLRECVLVSERWMNREYCSHKFKLPIHPVVSGISFLFFSSLQCNTALWEKWWSYWLTLRFFYYSVLDMVGL